MAKDEKTEILKKYEELKDAIDLINENVPELQKLYKETGKMQKAFKSELEKGLSSTSESESNANKAMKQAVESANYVKEQSKKLDECLSLMKSIQGELTSLKTRITSLEEIKPVVNLNPALSIKSVSNSAQQSLEPVKLNSLVEYEDLSSKDGKIKLNATEFNSFRLKFDGKGLADPYINALGSPDNKWKWNKANGYWYKYKNQENYDFAKSIIDHYDKNK